MRLMHVVVAVLASLQATTCERKVRVYDLEGDSESYIPEGETLISMSLSKDGRFLLVNLTSNSMHLWDLGDSPREMHLPAMPCASYQGANVSGGSGGNACRECSYACKGCRRVV